MIAVDSNLLIYAEGLDDPLRQNKACLLLDSLDRTQVILPAQALAELHRVLMRKGRWPANRAREAVLSWIAYFPVVGTRERTLRSAMECADMHGLQIFDALILAAAAEAGATVLLSEDMQHGFAWHGVTVINPFAPAPYEALIEPYLFGDG